MAAFTLRGVNCGFVTLSSGQPELERNMSKRIFISAGEPSGDIHGANLARALKDQWPDVQLMGFGGPKMAEAGVDIKYELTNHAVMWFGRVLSQIGTFVGVINQAARLFDEQRPDAVIVIDYPGLHWWIAKKARARGIPVFYHVPPQLWAWAGWRVRKIRDRFSYVFCSLPFEPQWYAEHGFAYAEYLGHPYFDELAKRTVDEKWISEKKTQSNRWIGILPGSRMQEIEKNLPMMIRAIEKVGQRFPDVRYAVACLTEEHKAMVQTVMSQNPLPQWYLQRIDFFVGKTPEILKLVDLAWTVSGSVSLELMYESVPTVVVYRIDPLDKKVSRQFITAPYITLTNLLAGWDIMPEYLTDHDVDQELADWATRWLEDPAEADRKRNALSILREQYGQPGASQAVAARIDNIFEAWAKAK
jgi:lipid-A-disaccharide synthase